MCSSVNIWKKDELFYLKCPTAKYISASICAYNFDIAAGKRSENPHFDIEDVGARVVLAFIM